MEEEETNQPTTPESTQITLTIPHDTAVALGVATIHFRALFMHYTDMASSVKHLDEVYHQILAQPHLAEASREMLRDMRWHVAGIKDEQPEGGSQHAAASHTQG